MSTPKAPSKKKPAVKPVEQKAKYGIGNKVFIIDRGRSFPGYILQAKVELVKSSKGLCGQMSMEKNSQAKLVEKTTFEYDLSTSAGWFERMPEVILYPTITAASLEFTNQFTHLLK